MNGSSITIALLLGIHLVHQALGSDYYADLSPDYVTVDYVDDSLDYGGIAISPDIGEIAYSVISDGASRCHFGVSFVESCGRCADCPRGVPFVKSDCQCKECPKCQRFNTITGKCHKKFRCRP